MKFKIIKKHWLQQNKVINVDYIDKSIKPKNVIIEKKSKAR